MDHMENNCSICGMRGGKLFAHNCEFTKIEAAEARIAALTAECDGLKKEKLELAIHLDKCVTFAAHELKSREVAEARVVKLRNFIEVHVPHGSRCSALSIIVDYFVFNGKPGDCERCIALADSEG